MSRVRKLTDIEIDEVSVVDRPANQHGLIAFAKSLYGEGIPTEEGTMPPVAADVYFDVDGDEVDPGLLEHGDVVYDQDGTELVYLEEDDDEEFGKASRWKSSAAAVDWMAGQGSKNAAALQRRAARQAAAKAPAAPDLATRAAKYKRMKAQGLAGPGADLGVRAGAARGFAAGRAGRDFGVERNAFGGNAGRAYAAAHHIGRNQGKYLAGAAGTTALGAGGYYAHKQNTSKSLGDEVLEALSKAVTDEDRDEIIAKAMSEVEIYKAQTEEMADALAYEQDLRLTEAYISKAAEYNLPVSPQVLGPILKSIAETLSDEELDVLDAIFEAISDALYDEVGYVGDTDNGSVVDMVDAYASELVGKSDMTHAEAAVAMYSAHPEAYEAYLAENGR